MTLSSPLSIAFAFFITFTEEKETHFYLYLCSKSFSGESPQNFKCSVLVKVWWACCMCLFLLRSAPALPFFCTVLQETTFLKLPSPLACRQAGPMGGNNRRLEGKLRSWARVFLSSASSHITGTDWVSTLIPAPSRQSLTPWFQFLLHSSSFWDLVTPPLQCPSSPKVLVVS